MRSAERVQPLHSRTRAKRRCILSSPRRIFTSGDCPADRTAPHARAAVLHALDLPEHMTANALLEFINAVGTHEQVAEIIQQYAEKTEKIEE